MWVPLNYILDIFVINIPYTYSIFMSTYRKWVPDFPGGAVVKNPPTNAGDTGWSPGPGRSHMPLSN